MVRRTGISIKFDRTLLFAAAVLAVVGPRWVMNTSRVPWSAAMIATLIAALAIVVGVVVHEMGHALAARLAGIKVGGITVAWWGGATSLGPATFGSSLLVALAGPVINGLFAAFLFLLTQVLVAPDAFELGIYFGAWINAFLTVFNLLPFAPLDGSHALSDLVALATGSREKGERLVAWVGIALIPLALAWFVMRGTVRSWLDIVVLLLVVGMVWKFSFDKLKQVDASRKSGHLVGRMSNPVEFARKGQNLGNFSGIKDVVVWDGAQIVGYVPADLVNTTRLASPNLLIEQLSSPVADERISASTSAIDLGEYAQGHYLVTARDKLGEGVAPSWVVEDHGNIIGILHYREHLAHITG